MAKFNRIVYGMGLRWSYTGDGSEVKVFRVGKFTTGIVCVLPRSVCVADDLIEVEETIRLHTCFGDPLLQ